MLAAAESDGPPAVVMVTAFGSEEVRAAAEDAGLRAFLVKPVSASQINDTLMRLTGGVVRRAMRVGTGAVPRLDGRCVLLVEDNEVNQEVARELLAMAGLTVTVADHGAMALECLRADDRIELVLMDLQMPVMDGLTATRAIREESKWAHIPIVAMTAHAMAEERERCLAAGMQDHLTKPIDPERLYAVLSERLGASEPGSGPSYRLARRLATAGVALADSAADRFSAVMRIDGLDAEEGRRRVAGNTALYLSLLQRAATQQVNAIGAISAALEAGDAAGAMRTAHTLKGVAGNLGATVLAAAAGQIEEMLGGGRPVPSEQLASIETTLRRFAAQVALAIPSTTAAASHAAAPGDPTVGRETSVRLLSLLEAGDAEAMTLLETEGRSLEAALGEAAHDRLVHLVGAFAFDEAATFLQDRLRLTDPSPTV
jgi:CheY-like chemotaxis protein